MDQKIVNWIQYDNQIKEHTDEVKKLKNKRDELAEGMMTEINSNDNLRENLPTYNITHMNTSLAFHKTNT